MKNYKQILEAINRGILLALDDYEDENHQVSPVRNIVKNNNATKELIQLYQYVTDLGLPSGTLWCKNNLGADCGEFSGDWIGTYYAWGETEEKEKFNELTYKFTGKMIKYNKYDNIINLEPEDDAAYLNMHYRNYKFRIPSKLQCEELIEYTKLVWVKNYNDIEGLNGCRYISKINDEEIFIPAGGYIFMGADGSGTKAIVMTATNARDKNRDDCCWALLADDRGPTINPRAEVYMNWCFYRTAGLPIRPVLNI